MSSTPMFISIFSISFSYVLLRVQYVFPQRQRASAALHLQRAGERVAAAVSALGGRHLRQQRMATEHFG